MDIDPVVLLAEELRATEAALQKAVARYDRERDSGEAVKNLVAALKSLYREFQQTIPTSALGAGELLRLASLKLPVGQGAAAQRLQEVADRLAAGRREHGDLVWLRTLQGAAPAAETDEPSAMSLLRLAILGAARPVLVFRAPVHHRAVRRLPGSVAKPDGPL